MRLTAAALAAALAGPAAAQELAFAEATPEEDAAIAAGFAEDLLDAEELGAMLFIGAARADLDGDGAPELLGMLVSGALCDGASGCPIGVFRGDDAAGWTRVATLRAETVTLERGATRGWRDLTLGGGAGARRVRWTGSGYAPR